VFDTNKLYVLGVGLVPAGYALDCQPGWSSDSVGYHADDGKSVLHIHYDTVVKR